MCNRAIATIVALALVLFFLELAQSEEPVSTSYASVGATNTFWNIAKEQGFYKKHGLDAEVI